jgi:hypothetical protein
MVLYFPPKGPTQSLVKQPTITIWAKGGTNPKSHEWVPPLNFYHNLSSKHSIANGNPPKIGVPRINREVDLNVTIMSTSSYRLNAHSKQNINPSFKIKHKGIVKCTGAYLDPRIS